MEKIKSIIAKAAKEDRFIKEGITMTEQEKRIEFLTVTQFEPLVKIDIRELAVTIHCNGEENRTPEAVKKIFKEILNKQLEDAYAIINDNMENIIKLASI